MRGDIVYGTIKAKGMKLKDVAEAAGMTYPTLMAKLKSGEFYASEILKLAKILDFTGQNVLDYFFDGKL